MFLLKAQHVYKAEQELLHRCVGGGGGGNRRPACLVAKQAVQVLASVYIIMYDMCHAHTLTQET